MFIMIDKIDILKFHSFDIVFIIFVTEMLLKTK